MELEGRTAVVTGGGRGIGREVAARLARAGALVVVSARGSEAIEGVAAGLREEGHRALAVPCDVTRPESVGELLRRVRSEAGKGEPGILVNNAGASSSDPVRRLELEEWERLLAVNATGTFLCTRAFLPAMVEAGWGRVVNVASVSGLRGGRYISAYAAAKHAQVGFTRSVALEVAGTGVTVNAVCPGFVDTSMTRETVERVVERTGRSRDEALEAVLRSSGQDRLVRPGEVANAVEYLCGDGAGAVNGATLVLDGGASAG